MEFVNSSKIQRYKAAIFDYDGTVLDSMPMWSSVPSRYARSLGAEPGSDFDEKMKYLSLEESAEIFRTMGAVGTDEELVDQVMAMVMERYQYDLQPKPGVTEVLDDLQRHGVRMCVASQTPSEMIRAANQRLGLDRYFEGVFSCGEWNTTKREPVIYQVAAESLSASPQETLVFEDIVYAVETAWQAGFPVISIYDRSSAGDREEITRSSGLYLETYKDWPGFEHLNLERRP